MKVPKASIANPPKAPTAHVAVAKVAIALRGITLASPQKVTGPPAAAVKSRVAAGAVPIPKSSSNATRGISNNSGTLIRIPNVAANAIPSA